MSKDFIQVGISYRKEEIVTTEVLIHHLKILRSIDTNQDDETELIWTITRVLCVCVYYYIERL